MHRVRLGTASWTDPTLLKSGWYPPEASSPEARLRFYASRFDLVEVDSTYYALPSERNAVLWTERTPPGFVFDIKAFSLMTRHPVTVRSLPKDVKTLLPPDVGARVYPDAFPPEAADLVWEMFRSALMPLHSAGKLGAVFFQFPRWFTPGRDAREYILSCRERLPDYRIAVELRQAAWFKDEDAARRTLEFFRSEEVPYVCVDMPQGFVSSVPPVAEATSDRLAVIRFHGRREETWEKKGVPVVERYRYDYPEGELREWVPRARTLQEEARETHVLFNNCYRDYGVRNAKTFGEMLGHAEP